MRKEGKERMMWVGPPRENESCKLTTTKNCLSGGNKIVCVEMNMSGGMSDSCDTTNESERRRTVGFLPLPPAKTVLSYHTR